MNGILRVNHEDAMTEDVFLTEPLEYQGKYVMWTGFHVGINIFPYTSFAIFAGGCLENYAPEMLYNSKR